ncbi:MAG TPA: A/G-specific adenine glycosylase [Cyclobacteriaceae bacterium]|nr:A/G-specific adenine glycosylase [Cyclobacteriaceae bacterium]
MKDFSNDIIEWYKENRRLLPWRETKDPYCIWLSEVILQQTRVNQGLPYYLRFIDAFPTVKDLARAPEDTVLRLWQGLGYYSRARNLHRCAKVVTENYNGVFPSTFEELVHLPGIGSYTAAAIASIAFNQEVAVVDGNVYRVLARLFGVATDISSTEGKKYFFELANELISSKHPGDHNQAVMEFGATHCTPAQPKCDSCVFVKKCVAFNKGLVDQLPVKERKIKKKTRYFYYFIFRDGNKIAMKKRTGRDIWNGLYEFHLIESAVDKGVDEVKKSDPLLDRVIVKEAGSIRHILTHQVLHIRFFEAENLTKNKKLFEGLSFVSLKKAGEMPKPIAITRYLETAGY